MTQNCNCHGSGGHLSQTVAAVLERPRYSPGLILEDSDLTAAVDYTRDLSRLLFRNLFGCGVICGLTVDVEEKCGLKVTVNSGLALDGCGDPVQLPKPVTITVDDNMLRDWKADRDNHKLWVVLCGKEKYCQPRSLVCESDEFDGAAQPTRIRAQAEVTITRTEPKCVCGCLPRAKEPNVDGKGEERRPDAGAARDEDECQKEHETRDECAEDCGCGTACDCGCCVLLAEATYSNEKWSVKHDRIRRLVRPKLIRDHEPQRASADAGKTEGATIADDAKTGRPMTREAVIARFSDSLGESAIMSESMLSELGLATKGAKINAKTSRTSARPRVRAKRGGK